MHFLLEVLYPTRNVPNYVLNSGQNASDPNTPSTKFMEKGDFLRWSNLLLVILLIQRWLTKSVFLA